MIMFLLCALVMITDSQNYPFSQHHCRLVWYSVALHCFIIGAQSTDLSDVPGLTTKVLNHYCGTCCL